jgi:beta-N-acetylglucosaminidase
MRHQRYEVRVRFDDDRLGVKAGEEYIAETYWLDPRKVTLLTRIPDGYDPQCNQYRSDVEWMRWAEGDGRG